MELGYVVAASITALPASGMVVVGFRNGRRVKKVHEEIRTNNGKRAGEYLELISHEQEFVARQLVGSVARQREMDEAMRRHIASDEARFAEVLAKLNEKDRT